MNGWKGAQSALKGDPGMEGRWNKIGLRLALTLLGVAVDLEQAVTELLSLKGVQKFDLKTHIFRYFGECRILAFILLT